MTTNNKAAEDDLVVQEHCIDLPGESVQCWIGGGTDRLKVILRKHRDVIFDINLGNGKTYTLETTESDFYNAREKKLVYAARHGKVEFKDGERLHVWVSRGFRGSLILKCDEHIISEVKPNELDTRRHTDDPKEKPAPIIVAIAAPPSAPKQTAPISLPPYENPDDSEESLHVHEVSKEGAPPTALRFFQEGGESLELDANNIITRNWIIGQLVGAGAYLHDNRSWIKDLGGCNFRLQRVAHKSGPKTYMIFNGNNKLRQYISASRYGMENTKIMRITGGAGGAKQAWDSAKGAALESVKVLTKEEGKLVAKGAGIAVFFTIAMDAAEWYKDFSEIGPDGKPKKDFYDLFAKAGINVLKAGLAAALATATVALGFAVLGFSATVAAPVILVVVGTILVGVVWSHRLDKGERVIAGALGEADLSNWLAKKFRESAQYLSEISKDVRYQRYALAPIIPIMR